MLNLTWFPPLFGLINTITGVISDVGIGLMMKAFCSFWSLGSFDCCLLLDFLLLIGLVRFGVLIDDLKLPLLGNLTIHEGGTIILACSPWITKEFFKSEQLFVVKSETYPRNIARLFSSDQSKTPCCDTHFYTMHKRLQQYPCHQIASQLLSVIRRDLITICFRFIQRILFKIIIE